MFVDKAQIIEPAALKEMVYALVKDGFAKQYDGRGDTDLEKPLK